jgi:hypothetical protein
MESINTVSATSASEINRLHAEAEQFRDAAVSHAGGACRAAIQCGELLEKVKEQNPGEFILWVESNCAFTRQTACNYMRVARRYGKALLQGDVDFQSLKELYQATGIMPEQEHRAEGEAKDATPPWIRCTLRLDKIIAELQAAEKDKLRQWCLETLKRL